jgi:hypothetical protein
MRKVLLVGLTVSFVGALTVPIGASVGRTMAPTPVVPPVVQHQSGVAFGRADFTFAPNSGQSHSGNYALTGQLGRGSYVFVMSYATSQCTQAGDVSNERGVARFVRSDGAVLTGTVTTSLPCAGNGGAPQKYVVSLTRGSRDLVGARLEFFGTFVTYAMRSGSVGLESWLVTGSSSARPRIGYWMVDTAGTVYAFGGVDRLGDAPTQSAVHIEPTPSQKGYWIVDASGRVFAIGDAHSFGSASSSLLPSGESVTSLSATVSGLGYWLFTDHGRVLSFGDAQFFGDLRAVKLNGLVVGSVVTPTGRGYYMVARDGGVFAFGDAKFRGSMGGTHLNQPVVGLVPTSNSDGYWLVAGDGGVFAFGKARFLGSMGSVQLSRPVIGMVRYGAGYLMVAQDGGIFDFSDAPFFGSLGETTLANPIVSAAAQ